MINISPFFFSSPLSSSRPLVAQVGLQLSMKRRITLTFIYSSLCLPCARVIDMHHSPDWDFWGFVFVFVSPLGYTAVIENAYHFKTNIDNIFMYPLKALYRYIVYLPSLQLPQLFFFFFGLKDFCKAQPAPVRCCFPATGPQVRTKFQFLRDTMHHSREKPISQYKAPSPF